MSAVRIKLVLLTCKLNGGGAERSLLEILRALDRTKFDPVLWRLDALNLYPNYLSPAVSTRVLPRLSKTTATTALIRRYARQLPPHLQNIGVEALLGGALRIARALRRLLRQHRGRMLVVSSQLSMNIYAAVVQWLLRFRVPVVFIEQNEPYSRYRSVELKPARDLAWRRIRQLYPRATHVICVSTAGKESLTRHFRVAARRVTAIPNPVPLAMLARYARRPPPAHPFYHGRSPVIICAARFHPLKNHALLLRSFARLRQRARAKLVLVGQGALLEAIRRTIEDMGLEDDVAVLDFRTSPFPLVAHARLAVLASYSEGQGLSVVEALACGLPVVCTDWAGVHELIRDGVNGIVSKKSDAAFARALGRGLKLAGLPTTRAVAIQSAQPFDISRIVPRYEALFASLARTPALH